MTNEKPKDDLHGRLLDGARREPMVLTITHYPNGAMSVEGPIDKTDYCLSLLENAKDAVRNHGRPRGELVVPARDVGIP